MKALCCWTCAAPCPAGHRSPALGGYLVIPGPATQHLRALEGGGHALGRERRALWEEAHVDALAEVNQGQAMLCVLRIEALVLQKPETEDRLHNKQG